MIYRFELSKLQKSPPSTPSESLISVGSDSSSSELTKTRSIIPDSILQLPSNLASKRASFDSGYISPRKINISKNNKSKTDVNTHKDSDQQEDDENVSVISGF